MRIIKLYHLHIFFIILLFTWVSDLSAQRQKKIDKNIFSFGIMGGLNSTQLDGDLFVGFDKIGLTGGIKSYTYFSDRVSLVVEILYTQKGSNIPHGNILFQNSVNDRKIELNYVDIPLLLKITPVPDKSNFYLETGPVISRLINHKITEKDPSQISGTVYNELTDDFSSLEYNLLMGVGVDYKRADLGFRYSFGLSKLYENPNPEDPATTAPENKEVQFLRNYQMGIVLSIKI